MILPNPGGKVGHRRTHTKKCPPRNWGAFLIGVQPAFAKWKWNFMKPRPVLPAGELLSICVEIAGGLIVSRSLGVCRRPLRETNSKYSIRPGFGERWGIGADLGGPYPDTGFRGERSQWSITMQAAMVASLAAEPGADLAVRSRGVIVTRRRTVRVPIGRVLLSRSRIRHPNEVARSCRRTSRPVSYRRRSAAS